jgi:hypothetical protein
MTGGQQHGGIDTTTLSDIHFTHEIRHRERTLTPEDSVVEQVESMNAGSMDACGPRESCNGRLPTAGDRRSIMAWRGSIITRGWTCAIHQLALFRGRRCRPFTNN